MERKIINTSPTGKVTITPTTVTFDNMKGHIITPKPAYMSGLKDGRHYTFDLAQYDSVYSLDNGWAGGFFLRSGDTYRVIIHGSGVPVVSDRSGYLRKIPKDNKNK